MLIRSSMRVLSIAAYRSANSMGSPAGTAQGDWPVLQRPPPASDHGPGGGLRDAGDYRGSRLSAGEKQLVSNARAFLADPPVLILDEATSSVYPSTEETAEEALRGLFK